MGFGFFNQSVRAWIVSLYFFRVSVSAFTSILLAFNVRILSEAPCSPMQASSCFWLASCPSAGLFQSMEELLLENQPAVLDLLSLQDNVLWDSFRQPPLNRPVSLFLKSNVVIQLIGLLASSQDPELHNVMVSASTAARYLHFPNKFLLVCKYEVQQSTCLCPFLNCLCQEVTTNALQKPPALLELYCVVLPADNRWLKSSPLQIRACEFKTSSVVQRRPSSDDDFETCFVLLEINRSPMLHSALFIIQIFLSLALLNEGQKS